MQLSIIHSFDYVHPFGNNLLGRISFEWDPDFDTPDALKFKLHNKVLPDDRYNSNENHRNASPGDNRMSCVNDKSNFRIFAVLPFCAAHWRFFFFILEPQQQALKHRQNQRLCPLRHHLLFKLLFKTMQ